MLAQAVACPDDRCRRSRPAAQERVPRHPPATGRLDLVEPQRRRRRSPARAALERAGRPVSPARPTLAVQTTSRPTRGLDERARPRLVGADLALELGRRARRVEPAVLAAQRPGQRRARPRLRRAPSSSPRSHGPSVSVEQRRPPCAARSASSSGAVSSPSSGARRLGDDRPGVEPVVHPHERDAGLARRRRGSPPGSASRRDGAAAATDGG